MKCVVIFSHFEVQIMPDASAKGPPPPCAPHLIGVISWKGATKEMPYVQ
jgi:hypothetical protein